MIRTSLLVALLLLAGCSHWRDRQENFHSVNADNQVYSEYLRHTTYPGNDATEFCARVRAIPNRAELSYYGAITEECRTGLYENEIRELRRLLDELPPDAGTGGR